VGVWLVTYIWGSIGGTYLWLGVVFLGVVGSSCMRSGVHSLRPVLAV
jgi:hypothetical protein